MNDFESYRYPNEMLVSRITRGIAWFLWALIGVLLVAVTLATSGVALLVSLAIVTLIVLARFILSFRMLEHGILLTPERFPNLGACLKQWQMRMSDHQPAPIYIYADPHYDARLLHIEKRPVILLATGAIEALTARGNLDELAALLYHLLAKARMAEDFEWVLYLPLYLTFPTFLLHLWLSRGRTLSADRVALQITSPEILASALAALALGPSIASRVGNDFMFGKEWPTDRRVGQLLELLSSTPRLATRLTQMRIEESTRKSVDLPEFSA